MIFTTPRVKTVEKMLLKLLLLISDKSNQDITQHWCIWVTSDQRPSESRDEDNFRLDCMLDTWFQLQNAENISKKENSKGSFGDGRARLDVACPKLLLHARKTLSRVCFKNRPGMVQARLG